MPIALAPFDPSRDFKAQANFRAAGRIWLRKHPFDKTVVNERVLRQLYEGRRITYALDGEFDQPAAPDPEADLPGDQPPEQQHEAEIAVEAEEDTEQPATAAEGVSVTGEGNAAAAPEGDSETVAATDKPQLDHDHDGTAGGSEPNNEGTRDERVKRVANRFTHDELLKKASGLKGASKGKTKTELAELLVDAGRVGDGAA
jgi:hypothetical protein